MSDARRALQNATHVAIVLRILQRSNWSAILTHEERGSPDNAYLCVGDQIGGLLLEPLGLGDIIGVHASDELAGSFCEPMIQRRGNALPGLPIKPYALVHPRVHFDDPDRVIARAIVDDR